MTTGPGSGSPPDGDDATFADVLNGFTLDSGRSRRKRKKAKESEAETVADVWPEDPASGAPAEYTGEPSGAPGRTEPGQGSGYFPGARSSGSYPAVESSGYFESAGSGYYESGYDSRYESGRGRGYEPDAGQSSGYFAPSSGTDFGTGFFEPAVNAHGSMLPERPEQAPQDEETAAVRPYALTGGRTKASYALELETLVSVKEAVAARLDAGAEMQFEHRQLVEECRAPRSVAEVAALLKVPVGVARVLISDAADAGLITVHKTVSGTDNAEAHLMLMERVLSGLRRL